MTAKFGVNIENFKVCLISDIYMTLKQNLSHELVNVITNRLKTVTYL